jgi:hypothetical protein
MLSLSGEGRPLLTAWPSRQHRSCPSARQMASIVQRHRHVHTFTYTGLTVSEIWGCYVAQHASTYNRQSVSHTWRQLSGGLKIYILSPTRHCQCFTALFDRPLQPTRAFNRKRLCLSEKWRQWPGSLNMNTLTCKRLPMPEKWQQWPDGTECTYFHL